MAEAIGVALLNADPSIQVKRPQSPIAGAGFDDEGDLVAITEPDLYAVEQSDERDRRDIARGVVCVIEWLLADDAEQSWRRLQILGLLLHRAGIAAAGAPRTQAELAERLHVTPGRASQLLRANGENLDFAGLFAEKQDSAKLCPICRE